MRRDDAYDHRILKSKSLCFRKMYAVGRLGSYISRGVYSVSGPFHPFGGAVDIIVVEQPDGSFKSSPWYVRFGKFQGVLKMKEKIVRISVNGVEASLYMYLDHKGEAYFLKEIEGYGEDGESVLRASPSSPSCSSSGDDADAQSKRRTTKSQSFNYDDDINRSETIINSRRSQILGLMFGRRSLKEERPRTEGEDGPFVARVDSLDRANIAADLLDLNWSTNLATKKKRKDVGSRFLTSDAATKLDDNSSKAMEICDESKEKSKEEEEITVDVTEYVKSEVDFRIGSSAEETQFIFSDLDEIEGGGAELSNDDDERSSVEKLDQAFASKVMKSSSINISSTSHTDEFKQRVQSMPNTRSDIKDLDSYLLQVPLSQSLDSIAPSVCKDIAASVVQEMSVCRHMEMGIDAAACEVFAAEKLDLRELMLDKVEQSLHEDSSTKVIQGGSWRLWPFSFNKSRSGNHTRDFVNKTALKTNIVKKILQRLTTPTSEQLASLNLKQGSNSITFTFSTAVLGNQRVEARIFLWKWNTRVIISDVDGTITKSDVLGQFMPLVGMDWSQTGVTHLFSSIKENGYQMLFLSARAISQAYYTRQFLFNLKQNGKCLPEGPVVISPDGLFPSLYREVIRRAPHEFKISCLEDIKSLFPPDCNPFYAGFGNRDTDEISYLKVGIPKGKIFIINPKGQVAVNRQINTKSYTSLHALVHGMFPHVSTSHQQEDFNCWNYWKIPPVDIDCK